MLVRRFEGTTGILAWGLAPALLHERLSPGCVQGTTELFCPNPGAYQGLPTLPPSPLSVAAVAAMAGMKTASGDYIDSSWELRVFVGEEDPEAESVTLRVTGESHIGGVLLKIVEQISECPAARLLNSVPRVATTGVSGHFRAIPAAQLEIMVSR